MLNKKRTAISIVIPVYNEEKNVKSLLDKLVKVLRKIKKSYEIIFIDDGSVDSTLNILKSLSDIKILRLSRNFGQTAALAAGFREAYGNVIITLDGDLQNDPNDIPKLLEKADEGYDIVNGWRFDRQDPLSKKFPSLFANWIISKMSGVKIHDFGCTLKVYKRSFVKDLNLYGEMHRFIPVIAAINGAKITEIKVKHHKRKFGTSKYGLSRTLRVILDLISVKYFLSYSYRPIHLFGSIGIVFGSSGFLIALFLSLERIFYKTPLFNRPLLLLGVVLMIFGAQFLGIGLLAEIITRGYFDIGKKHAYRIEEKIKKNGNKKN